MQPPNGWSPDTEHPQHDSYGHETSIHGWGWRLQADDPDLSSRLHLAIHNSFYMLTFLHCSLIQQADFLLVTLALSFECLDFKTTVNVDVLFYFSAFMDLIAFCERNSLVGLNLITSSTCKAGKLQLFESLVYKEFLFTTTCTFTLYHLINLFFIVVTMTFYFEKYINYVTSKCVMCHYFNVLV